MTRFRAGDEVFGIGKGSYAEYARAHEDKLAPKPANLAFEQAAAVALSGPTALQGMRDDGKVRPGQEVLVIGASGGVGTFVVQIAQAFGAQVTGVRSCCPRSWARSWPSRSPGQAPTAPSTNQHTMVHRPSAEKRSWRPGRDAGYAPPVSQA